jgi:hypothetical protein
METLFVLGILGLVVGIWLVLAIPIYKGLRAAIVRSAGSFTKRALFTIACGIVVAPGLLSLGHPPPIPFPGAALIGLAYLSQILRGQRSEDSFVMAYANLASWAVVTACIGIGELWRLRRRAYLIRELAFTFARNFAAGLKTGRPRWVIPGTCIAAAILALLVLNGPVGEPTRTQGRVIACGPHPHWLTRINTLSCAVELSDGSIYFFKELDHGDYDHGVTMLRFQRRFVGTHHAVLKN